MLCIVQKYEWGILRDIVEIYGSFMRFNKSSIIDALFNIFMWILCLKNLSSLEMAMNNYYRFIKYILSYYSKSKLIEKYLWIQVSMCNKTNQTIKDRYSFAKKYNKGKQRFVSLCFGWWWYYNLRQISKVRQRTSYSTKIHHLQQKHFLKAMGLNNEHKRNPM